MALFAFVEHFGLAARDTEALARWYCEALGFSVHLAMENGPGQPKTFFIRAASGAMVEILPATASPAQEKPNSEAGWVHLAVGVSDFKAAAEKLERCGAKAEGPVREIPGGVRVRFYRDQEGNLFHIVFRPKPL
jgi:glyoxylase I family protein